MSLHSPRRPAAPSPRVRPVVRLIRGLLAFALAFLTVPFATLSPAYAEDPATAPTETVVQQTDPPPEPAPAQEPPPAEEEAPPAVEPAPEPEPEPEPQQAPEPEQAETTTDDASADASDSPAKESRIAALALPDPDCTVTGFTQNTVEGGGGSWINGALNQNNSNYAEGDLVPQKVDLSGLVPGEYTLGFTFDRTKNGKFAYDYVSGLYIDGSTGASATWASSTDPADFDGPAPTDSPGGTYTVSVTITFVITDDADATAVIGWDGHIASELDYGPDTGAGSISGAPYHFSLSSTGGDFGCDSGNRDNQLMADAVDSGEITIIKDAVPNDGQDFHFTLDAPNALHAAFDLDDDADGDLPNSETYNVPPGVSTGAEVNLPDGWNLTGISCVATSGTPGFQVNLEGGSFTGTLADNDHLTCTFTNSRTSSLEVDKLWVINGADPVQEGDEPAHLGLGAQLTVDGNDEPWNTAIDGYLQGTTVTLDETVTFGNDLCDWADDTVQGRVTEVNDGVMSAPLPHDMALGGGANHATITNVVTCDAELILRKVVENTNGGTAVPGDFSLVASPAGGGADLVVPEATEAGTPFTVPADASYDLSETGGPDGYTLSGIDCGSGEVLSVQVPAGESRTCTFTNHDNPGSLTLLKEVDDNGTGDTTPADEWTLTATPDGIDDQDPISGTTGVSGDTKAGSYDLSEEGPATHTQGTWSCEDADGAVEVTGGAVTLEAAQDVTCTIVNTAIAPELTLVKIVAPENAQDGPEAFELTATPVDIVGEDGFSGPGPQVSDTVKVGSYDLSETGPEGYDPSDAGWTCVDGEQQPVAVTDDRVSVGVADDITCTIVNVAVPATVEVDKYWVVNGGEPMLEGTEPDHLELDAQLLVNGNEHDWDAILGGFLRGAPLSLDEEVMIGNDLCRATDATLVEANGSAMDEDLPYDTAVLGGPNHYTITNEVTCHAGLTLLKVVDNGDADPTAWSLTATRGDASSLAFAGGSTPATGTVTAEAPYTLAENDADDRYIQVGAWECTEYAELAGDVVEVAAGREATCTVTNATGELTLVKVVENPNGGTATADDFTLHAGDQTVPSGETIFVDPEATFDLSETGGPEGYTLESIVCGNEETDSVQVPAGEAVTCTFTNVDAPGRLILDKVVDDNSTGDDTDAEAWHLSGTPSFDGQDTVEGDGHAEGDVKAGTYTLAEDGPATHTSGEWTCEGPDGAVPVNSDDEIQLAAMETVTCEITNTAIQPTLTLVKVVDPGETGDETPATEFVLTATPDGIADQPALVGEGGATSIVKVGDYVLSEEGPDTYAADEAGWTCVDEADETVPVTDATVAVGLADDITCTIVNHAIPSEWMVAKTSDPESGATVQPGEQIDYTVTLTKVGNGVPVEGITVTDTLTGVEDAWVSGLDAGATIENGVITWEVAELGDEPLQLTYTVTVGPDAWNSTIENQVTPGPVPCVDVEGVDCDETEHFTPHYTLDKAVALLEEPGDGDDLAEPGEQLEYTLTIHNDTEHATVDTVITDNLADVLDDGDVISMEPGLALNDDELTWTVSGLEPGETRTVSYVVEIHDGAWGVTLHNVATPVPGDGGECIPAGELPAPEPGVEDDLAECTTDTDTPPVTTMVIEKHDLETDEVLAEATFELWSLGAVPEGGCDFPEAPGDGDQLVGTATTSEIGRALFNDLQHGCYLLIETEAPPGFELPEDNVLGVQVDEANFVAGGQMAPIVINDFAEGQLAIVAKRQFEKIGGEWVESDGKVGFGDTVRYVVRVSATGPRNFHDILVTDYVPGFNPDDTQSTVDGTLVEGSAACEDGLTCTVSVDPETQLVTWDIGDLEPDAGVTIGGTAVMEVVFPEAPEDLDLDPGESFTSALWNVGFLEWDEAVPAVAATGFERAGGGAGARVASAKMIPLPLVHHTLTSNEVLVTATMTAPPAKVPPKQGELPQTGAPAGILPLGGAAILLIGLGLVLTRKKS